MGSGVQAAESLRVAAAANLLYPMKELAQSFSADTGAKVELVFNSSGRLLSLIEQGAPFDLFFSADAKRPERLYQEGLALAPVTYTHGVLVFWSRDKGLCAWGWPQVLASVSCLAIADPRLAPYGEVAQGVLRKAQAFSKREIRLVKALTVSQAFQWAESGNAQAALVSFSLALSKAGRQGCYLTIKQAPLIEQKACVLKKGHPSLAKAFLEFVLSPRGQAILAKYGYR